MQLIITRHMESQHNAPSGGEATFAGSRVDSHLTENGQRDALIVGKKISEMGGGDVLYHSYLKRTKQTAEIIGSVLAQQLNQHLPLVELNGIEEVDGGDFTGYTAAEIREQFPEAAENFYSNNIRAWQFPHGETYQGVTERLQIALDTIRASSYERPIMVCHANTIKVLLEYLKDDPTASVTEEKIDMLQYDPNNQSRGIWQYIILTITWS